MLHLENQKVGSKTVWVSYYFNFERNYNLLKILPILLNKNINFDKTKPNQKFKIPRTVLERRTLCFRSHKNRKLKVKLWSYTVFLVLEVIESFQCVFLRTKSSYQLVSVHCCAHIETCKLICSIRSNHWRCPMKVGLHKNFLKFTIKHLC